MTLAVTLGGLFQYKWNPVELIELAIPMEARIKQLLIQLKVNEWGSTEAISAVSLMENLVINTKFEAANEPCHVRHAVNEKPFNQPRGPFSVTFRLGGSCHNHYRV